MQVEAMLDELGAEEWTTDGFGMSSILICPHGHRVEQDGTCPDGCVSPLREHGLI
jgi:hypothetical protein